MAPESEGAQLRRDRERQRTAERQRIAEERARRRQEAQRLRSGTPSPAVPSREPLGRAPPRRYREAGPPPGDDASAELGGPAPPGPTTARPRGSPIGTAVLPPSVTGFLAWDPTVHFDLQKVNRLPLAGLVPAVGNDRQLLAEVAGRAAALMTRVKQEVDDPLNAGAFLREQVLEWYRSSAGASGWVEDASGRWSGLFAESRMSGGRLQPWLNQRLWATREAAVRAGRLGSRLRQTLGRDRREQTLVARTPHQQILGEVAQALLDDLAAHPREPGTPCPLVHLSELAVRRQVTTVNDALALLFNSPETGPFVLLHPNRYPDCEELEIRPPAAGAQGAALAFLLVPGRAGRRSGVAGRASSTDVTGGEPGASADPDDLLEGAAVWEATDVPKGTWQRLADARRRDRKRLEAPPKEYRARAAYLPLRSLIVDDPEFRRLFLAVRWRGRPAGLPLLATLLQKGKLSPEVATDHEYLDAELNELRPEEGGEPSAADRWAFSGWTVRREGDHAAGFRYVAERDAPAN